MSEKFTPGSSAWDMKRSSRFVLEGCMISAPTTASTKTANRVDIKPGFAVVDGLKIEQAGGADQACIGTANGGALVADEKEKKFALVAVKKRGGGGAFVWVESAQTAFGTEPDDVGDTQIRAIYGSECSYLIVGQTRITRTGDTTIAQTFQYDTREGRGFAAS